MKKKVVVTPEVKKQMRSYRYYLKDVLKNEKAAVSVRDNYKETIRKLEMVAERIRICENPDLARKRIRKKMYEKLHNTFSFG